VAVEEMVRRLVVLLVLVEVVVLPEVQAVALVLVKQQALITAVLVALFSLAFCRGLPVILLLAAMALLD
jgi:hypothetical protein